MFGTALAHAERYAALLVGAGVERGLLGPREGERIWVRHLLNSAAVAALIPQGASVCDLGSGAGLPGIPVALVRPDVGMTLLEPLLRRAVFLDEVVAALALAPQVQVVRQRAEEHRVRYDVVLARAVAPLPRLWGWAQPLLRSGGVLLAVKGASVAAEVAALAGHQPVVHTLAGAGGGPAVTVVSIRSRRKDRA